MWMYLQFFLLALCSILVTGFVIPVAYTGEFTDSAHFKADMSIGTEALEMIEKENQELRQFDVKDTDKQFFELNRLAKMENSKVKRPVYWINVNDVNFITTERTAVTTTTSKLTTIAASVTHFERTTNVIQKKHGKSAIYDYDKFLKEYYDEMVYLDLQNDTYHPKAEDQSLLESLRSLVYLGDGNYSNAIGIRAVKSLREESFSTEEFVGRLWRLVKVWLLVYLAIAVPFWCTKGWSCCCLCCQLFKPSLIIEEAKTYYIENPPGILKKPSGVTLYEPSDKERECYMELEHLIKII